MQEGQSTPSKADQEVRPSSSEEATRPQRGGEGATTRFGMEDGDNTDVPATGGPRADEDEAESSS